MTQEFSKEDLEQIIPAGLEFIRVITQVVGPERGMELWDSMSQCLGDDVKGQIFFAMLTGETGTKVTMLRPGARDMKVNIIKTVRSYSGLGLKESKDLVDRLDGGWAVDFVVEDYRQRSHCLQALRQLGVDCR